MKTRVLIGVAFVLGLGLLILAFPLGLWTSFPAGLQALHGQGSEESQFWVFDGHMHPTWSVYYRGGSLAEPNDRRFALPAAIRGGLGASFFNTSIDEFLEANHLAVKEALRQFDHFYREIAKYPNQIGVATNGQEIRSLREEGKIAAILTVEGALAIESDLGVLRMF
ncbi:MAG: membrane dipeptidase, partial [Acidobacteria bacterium]|nr:membrane dipeptidase [Acidobacteriota bacterium]